MLRAESGTYAGVLTFCDVWSWGFTELGSLAAVLGDGHNMSIFPPTSRS